MKWNAIKETFSEISAEKVSFSNMQGREGHDDLHVYLK